MDFGDKRKKQKPYSEYERQTLMQLVQQKIDIVENRRTDVITQKKKNDAWEDIRNKFNNSDNVSHKASVAQLKKMWQNLKSRAREAKAALAQKKLTDCGPAHPDIEVEETQVLSIIPTVIPSINVKIDSDISQPRTFKSCKYLGPTFI
ncbi:myb/SANT-like DNA-binding domain-containing protein 3 [Papilio machaon]|uniref:myb/SANT-like DNA-binding domain-containing protein 3 n=1 Tax=Papilio machaon TaxID=76193 RepID=UPI001E664359|nr:myb/SANT-like DNA-binding domain-containing protein 3 [Papilio machaon]